MLLQISYDLRQPGRNYNRLFDALQSLGARRVLESQWLLASRDSASDVWDYLASFVDTNDALWVQSLDSGAAWGTGSLLVSDSEMQSLLRFAQARAA